VKFSDQVESQKALNDMNGRYIYGRQIKTKYIDFKSSTASFKKISEPNTNTNTNANSPNIDARKKSSNCLTNINLIEMNDDEEAKHNLNLNNFYTDFQNASYDPESNFFNLNNFYMNNGLEYFYENRDI
jgi:hypothetical protein